MKYFIELFKSNWSNWTDISVGAVQDYRYVLQGRRHRNGKFEFRVSTIGNAYGCQPPTMEQLKEIKHGKTVTLHKGEKQQKKCGFCVEPQNEKG